jgi:hypothetical protein
MDYIDQEAFYKWAREQTIPSVNFDLEEAIVNSLSNVFDVKAEDQFEVAKSTFDDYVQQGVSSFT